MAFIAQKTSNRNIVLSAAAQASYGEVMADANLTQRQRFDPSSAFTVKPSSRNDKMMAGKGNEFATSDTITAWDTDGTIKSEADTFFLGWALAFLFGTDTVAGAGPYTHTFSIPETTATAPCTTVYVEETGDQKRKFQDMSVKSVSIDIAERGAMMLTADLVGTGRWDEIAMVGGPPALTAETVFLCSDVGLNITPSGGALNAYSGRLKGMSIKLDRGTAPFQSTGDGLYAAQNVVGDFKFSCDLTIAANAADDINQVFETGQRCAVSIGNPVQWSLSWPSVRFKANKVGNVNGVVTWALSFDETTALQVIGGANAIAASIINSVPLYLSPV